MDGYILLTGLPSTAVDGRADAASDHDYASTPHLHRRSNSDGPPMSSVLCAVKTPSGKSIAASFFSDTIDIDNNGLTDLECIERCMDQCWEPAIFNLGQSYRKLKRYGEAIVCFEKCTSLNPVSWYLVNGVWRFISYLSTCLSLILFAI
jgi:tetratricopeptide (TPR) repeat protein